MASVPPPQGLNETDYETIEAAVTETVRGRWFLSEFARRNRAGEMRQLLDAMARLEVSVAASQTALPSADPSVRLLIQRIKEVAGQLDGLVGQMREAGVEARFFEAVDLQARAVAGMMRGAPPAKPLPSAPAAPASIDPPKPVVRMPRAELPAGLAAPRVQERALAPSGTIAEGDPRMAALAEVDALALVDKLALFS